MSEQVKHVVIIGEGGRESALGWLISKTPYTRVSYLPGNGGNPECDRIQVDLRDLKAVLNRCSVLRPDLVIVGPEAPLAAGIVDQLQKLGLAVFGPTRAAAKLETSKAFAKEFCRANGIATPKFETVDNYADAVSAIGRFGVPVVKADGLCAGKGVFVPKTHVEALQAAHDLLVLGIHGAAGERIIIEEKLEGPEDSQLSVMAFCDGVTARLLPMARDHKRLLDGDQGPNTGGMGAFSPVSDVDDAALRFTAMNSFIKPTLRAMREQGTPFQGLLYVQLMVMETPRRSEPYLIEFNARFGDPELQVVAPLIESNLFPYFMGCTTLGGLRDLPAIMLKRRCSVGVTLASAGYPSKPRLGDAIIDGRPEDTSTVFFPAGVRQGSEGAWFTSGGRVGTVVATGTTFAEARRLAYEGVGQIEFPDMQFRRDIGAVL